MSKRDTAQSDETIPRFLSTGTLIEVLTGNGTADLPRDPATTPPPRLQMYFVGSRPESINTLGDLARWHADAVSAIWRPDLNHLAIFFSPGEKDRPTLAAIDAQCNPPPWLQKRNLEFLDQVRMPRAGDAPTTSVPRVRFSNEPLPGLPGGRPLQ